jgi:ADP-ribosylation factor-like protein 6
VQHQYNEVVPTVGFKIEQFVKNNISFTMFDMSGASTHRDLWTAYYAECDAVIYVVDCKDKLRICVAKKELDDMLENPGVCQQGPSRCAAASAERVLLSAPQI